MTVFPSVQVLVPDGIGPLFVRETLLVGDRVKDRAWDSDVDFAEEIDLDIVVDTVDVSDIDTDDENDRSGVPVGVWLIGAVSDGVPVGDVEAVSVTVTGGLCEAVDVVVGDAVR